MSQVESLLVNLLNDGVRVSIKGINLIVDAPSGVLTHESKEMLRVLKPDILRFLQRHGDYETYYNQYVDAYNEKLERVLRNVDMFEQFNTVLEERIAIIEFDGNLSRPEAEEIATEAENIRQLVLSL